MLGASPSGCGVTAGKHAVTTIAGTKNATYCYVLNGNMVSGGGRSIAYTSYDLPQTITRGFSTVTFSYGPERERYKRVDSTSAALPPASMPPIAPMRRSPGPTARSRIRSISAALWS